jgi:PAS domain S-box-containing protein
MAQKELDSRFFPLIFDNISHGIFTIDADGRITSFNRMAESLTGYSKEEVLGRQCHQIFRADFCQMECPLKRSMKTREPSEAVEVNVITKDGRTLPIAISTSALIDKRGAVLGGVEMFRDLSAVAELRKRLLGSYVFEDIVSKSRCMQKIFEVIPLVANSQSNVLVEGESGTGKELVSRAIHNLSSRRNKPFVAINCAALPDQLLESELFGYKKGAFTDAKKNKPGRFAVVDGGTILLDEIGDLSLAMQVKLLRVLETKEFTPLGDNTTVKADFRVIACTNKNLAREVQKKRFRSDLYFRLNVVRLSMPPLSERREDIPLLVRHFIDRFNALQGRRIARCSERVIAALMGYPFPGNVRELENAIEHAFVVCIGDIIQLEDLPSHIVAAVTESAPSAKTKFLPLDNAEAATINSVLAKHFGNRNRTAAELGVSRNTLWRKMKRFGIS